MNTHSSSASLEFSSHSPSSSLASSSSETVEYTPEVFNTVFNGLQQFFNAKSIIKNYANSDMKVETFNMRDIEKSRELLSVMEELVSIPNQKPEFVKYISSHIKEMKIDLTIVDEKIDRYERNKRFQMDTNQDNNDKN